MNFYGMYFEDGNGNEFRVGIVPGSNQYQPAVQQRVNGSWIAVSRPTTGTPKNQMARTIRQSLPCAIPFPENHTQNEVMELIHQAVYNLMRAVNENVNYRGAHN